MIKCKQFTEKIHVYLNGETPADTSRMGMWMHQMMCSNCRHYMHQIQDVIRLGEKIDARDKEEFECSDKFKSDLVKNYKKTNPGLDP